MAQILLEIVIPKRGGIARGICCSSAESRFLAARSRLGMTMIQEWTVKADRTCLPALPQISQLMIKGLNMRSFGGFPGESA